MTSEPLWGAIALLAFAGWGFTLYGLTKAILPMANALAVLHKLDATFDERVSRVVERYREQMKKRTPDEPAPRPVPARDAAAAALEGLFGDTPIEATGFPEQPDLEVVG